MRMITLADAIEHILVVHGRPESDFLRCLRVLSSSMDEMQISLFPVVKTVSAKLSAGLSASLPSDATFINKIGLKHSSGYVCIVDCVDAGMAFAKKQTVCSCDQELSVEEDTISHQDHYVSKGVEGGCPSCTFFNYGGTHMYGLRGNAHVPRAVVDEAKNAVFFDGTSSVKEGQEILIEYTPGHRQNELGATVIPADALNMFSHLVARELESYDNPGSFNIHQQKFIASLRDYRLRNSKVDPSSIISSLRGSFSRAVKG